jgi:phage terminase small subunit
MVLAEYAKIAFFDPSRIFRVGADGDPFIDFSDATKDDWAAVTSVQSEDYLDGRGDDARQVRKVKVTLSDKKSALDSVAKHLGMFTEKVEHSGEVGIAQVEVFRLPSNGRDSE